jgi:hypothetical protein
MYCYEHTDVKSTVIGAMVKKETTTVRLTLYEKTIGFINFNDYTKYV